MSKRAGSATRVLFITPDAGLTGAPKVLEYVAATLRDRSGARVSFCVLGGGPMLGRFQALGPTARVGWGPWTSRALQFPHLRALLARFALFRLRLRAGPPDVVYVNTLATGGIETAAISKGRVRVVAHAHELTRGIDRWGNQAWIARLLARADLVIVPSRAVEAVLRDRFVVDPGQVVMVHECIDVSELQEGTPATSLREALAIPATAFVAVACGTADWRKGPDLFVQVARQVIRAAGDSGGDVHFVWLGGKGNPADDLRQDIATAGLGGRVHVVPTMADARLHLREFDVFALTSREDPYPLVMLEAAASGLPVVAFESSGGAQEFVGTDAGLCVPYLDVEAFAGAIETLRRDEALRDRLGAAARERAVLHDRSIICEEIRRLLEQRLGMVLTPRGAT